MERWKQNGEDAYYIPSNIFSAQRFLGFKRRNWIEGGISTVIVCGIIFYIPFVLRVKIIFMVVLGGATLLLNLVGYKNQSISEIIINFIHYMLLPGSIHLKDIRYVKNKTFEIKDGKISYSVNESILEKGIRFAKEKFREITEER